MKKLVAIAMILSLGMFCTVGCGPAPKPPVKPGINAPEKKPNETKPGDTKPGETKPMPK